MNKNGGWFHARFHARCPTSCVYYVWLSSKIADVEFSFAFPGGRSLCVWGVGRVVVEDGQ